MNRVREALHATETVSYTHLRSVPMERLIDQAKELAAQGVKELILVAQETTVYGVDLYGKKSLHLLLEQLCRISGLRWIRILYCYPEEIYEDLIQTMKREEKICHYLDLPIQHASEDVYKRQTLYWSRFSVSLSCFICSAYFLRLRSRAVTVM